MCGRFTICSHSEEIAERFNVALPQEGLKPRYNAAPGQSLPVITNERPNDVQFFRWGLLPTWAKDPSMGSRLINARGDTIAQKPSFRNAFKTRRCLVIADGFYEWQKSSSGKQPMRFALKTEELFAFAGLWELWHSPQQQKVYTFTIITTEPNEIVAPIHNRMPVILRPEQEQVWLKATTPPAALESCLRPYCANKMKAYPVSRRVNSAQIDEATLIQIDNSGQSSFEW